MSAFMPTCSRGVTTMKMIRRTRTTSTRGVTLMSPLGPRVCLAGCILGLRTHEEVDDFRLDRVDVDVQVLDPSVEVVEQPDGRDGDEEAERGRDERLGD